MFISTYGIQSAAFACDTLHEACCVQLEFKLRDALRENATASREVKSMRASLKSLQLSKLRQPSRGRRQPDEPVGDAPGITQFGEPDKSTSASAIACCIAYTNPLDLLAKAQRVPELTCFLECPPSSCGSLWQPVTSKKNGTLRAGHEDQYVMQGISESTARALQLAEQRLAEAAAELQRRAGALRDVTSERNAALAEVCSVYAGLVGCTESGDAFSAYALHGDNALVCVVCQHTPCTVSNMNTGACLFLCRRNCRESRQMTVMQVTTLKAQWKDTKPSGISKADSKNVNSPGTEQLKDQACSSLHLPDASKLCNNGLPALK